MEEKQSHYRMNPIRKSAENAAFTRENSVNGEKAAEAAYHQHSNTYLEADALKRYAEIQPNSKGPAPHVVRFTRRRTVTTRCVLINVLLILLLIGIAIAIYFVVTRMRYNYTDAVILPATDSPLLFESMSTTQSILLLASLSSPSSLSSSLSLSSSTSSRSLDGSSDFVSESSSAFYNWTSDIVKETVIVEVLSKTLTPPFEPDLPKSSEVLPVSTATLASEPTQVRLSGALSDQGEGRVEVLHLGEWGTVCKTLFNSRIATVICRMLGYDGRGIYTYSRFGSGEGRIWLSSLICMGNETSVDECQHDEWGVNSCEHKDDVSISCQ